MVDPSWTLLGIWGPSQHWGFGGTEGGDHQITKASCEQNSPCFEERAWGEASTSHGNEEMKTPKMDIVRLRKSYTVFGC